MLARDLMTTNPACCTPNSTLREVARMMVEHDCGEIPVLDAEGTPLGVITDRDICCRGVAVGSDPHTARAVECMTAPAITAYADDTADRCQHLMREHMIRRLPIVDRSGFCIGIVSQADFARRTSEETVSSLVRDVSIPTPHASR